MKQIDSRAQLPPPTLLRVDSVELRRSSQTDNSLLFSPSKITVFIGPNNGGKTRTLKEIRSEFTGEIYTDKIFVVTCEVSGILADEVESRAEIIGTNGVELDDINRKIFRIRNENENKTVTISDVAGYVRKQDSEFVYKHLRESLYKYFILDLNGSNRLSILNDSPSQDIKTKPRNLAAKFFVNNELREQVSNICFESFGFHFLIDATDLGKFKFSGSIEKPSKNIERSLEDEAIEFFKNCFLLSSRSDGTRAFLGIYSEVIAGSSEIIFLDEPEAFLHPSLSRRLAQEISNNIDDKKQIFVATHSASFLSGLLSTTEDVNIVRLSQFGSERDARLLPKSEIQDMMRDPLLRSAGVLEALFHSSCVVVEGDADSAFYREINDRLYRFGDEHIRDGAFICSHSKQAAHRMVTPLRAVGIPTACIFDIDWIKEDGTVATAYLRSIGIPSKTIESMKTERRMVRTMLENADADYKRKGGVALLGGSDLDAANMFFDRCEEFGLFTVRGGELESWLGHLAVSPNKTNWIPRIFDAMGSDPTKTNYAQPKEGDVWDFLRRVSNWMASPTRKGMLS